MHSKSFLLLVGAVSLVAVAASPGRAATRVFLTPTVVEIVPGETAVIEVWLEDTVSAGMGPLRGFVMEVPCDATPLGAVTGTLSHDVSGPSPHVDTARADFVFSTCVLDASCIAFPTVDQGTCPGGNPRVGAGVSNASFSVDVTAPVYLGEVSYTASLSGIGTFEIDIVAGLNSELLDDSGANIPFTTSPATVNVVPPTPAHVFFTPEESAIQPGETAVFEIWLEDTVSAGMGPLKAYQIEVPCDATPLGAVTGALSHDVSGRSPHIDTARADYVFSACVQNGCFSFPAADIGACPTRNPRLAAVPDDIFFTVEVTTPRYLGEVSYTASSSGTGAFEIGIVIGGNSALVDDSSALIPFTTTPATVHVVPPPSAHVFFVPEESTIRPGETVDLEVWLEDTVSTGLGPLRTYQMVVSCDATPLGATTATLSHDDFAPSPRIDTARADFVFSACEQDGACTLALGIIGDCLSPQKPLLGASPFHAGFSVDVTTSVYLGEVSYTASASGVGTTFALDIVRGSQSFLWEDATFLDIPFTTTPATIHVQHPTKVFMVPDQITVAAGERFAIEVWVDDTVSAGMGPIRDYKISLDCSADKFYGLGWVQQQTAPGSPPMSCADGESPCIDTSHPEYIFASSASGEVENFSACALEDPYLAANTMIGPYVDVLPGQPKYLGAFGFLAGGGSFGEFGISIQNPNDVGAGGSGNGGSGMRSGSNNVVPFSVEWPGVRVFVCECEPPLAEDSLGLTCAGDADCPNRSVCIDYVCYNPKNRYLSFDPNPANTATPKAFRVTLVSSENHPGAVGRTAWVGAPNAAGASLVVNNPVTRTWNEAIIHLTGCFVSPVAEYDIQSTPDGGTTFSGPLTLPTTARPIGGKWWGDTVGSFDGTKWLPPQGVTNIDDAVSVIKTWQVAAGSPEIPRSDIVPQEPNRIVNFNDVLFVIFAFQGNRYPFGCALDPCWDNVAVPCP